MSIHAAGTGSNAANPGTKIGDLTGTIGSNAGQTTYTPGAGNTITLNGATTYFVQITGSDTDARSYGTTASDAQDTTSTSGWAIADTGRTFASNRWGPASGGRSLRFTVNATVPAPTCTVTGIGVCNISETAANVHLVSSAQYGANAFTTGGASTDRYSLNSVVLDVANSGSGQLAVSIHAAGTGSNAANPGTKIGDLTGTISGTAGETTYSASGLILNGATTYFVRVAGNAATSRNIGTTASDAQDASKGWTIANTGRIGSGDRTSWSALSSGRSLRFTVSVAEAPNRPATGKPGITGTAKTGGTLTATKGDIADEDGLPAGTFPTGYTFQWIRVAGGKTETDIDGATTRTYTVTQADVGSTLKVKVSFTDLRGGAESRTSDATAVVTAPTCTVTGVGVCNLSEEAAGVSGGHTVTPMWPMRSPPAAPATTGIR